VRNPWIAIKRNLQQQQQQQQQQQNPNPNNIYPSQEIAKQKNDIAKLRQKKMRKTVRDTEKTTTVRKRKNRKRHDQQAIGQFSFSKRQLELQIA
jgi:hypothetical protein